VRPLPFVRRPAALAELAADAGSHSAALGAAVTGTGAAREEVVAGPSVERVRPDHPVEAVASPGALQRSAPSPPESTLPASEPNVKMPPGDADDGLVAAAEIRRAHPRVAVLVLSQHLEPTYMLELVGEDASGVGYLLKDRVRDVTEFLDAVERVGAGGTAFDPEVVKSLVGGRRRSALDEGRSNKAIGRQLHVSTRAVERDVQPIFQKLELPDTEDDNRRVLAVLALLGH
jgi:DNA-binding NarL/FixJ family response regulator